MSAKRMWGAAPWRRGRGEYLWRRRHPAGMSPSTARIRDHIAAGTDWLERCQDASPDGGLAGRYRLRGSWTTSYPETTGYAIPTLLRLADYLPRARLVDRAERAVRFLVEQQMDDGAFPGGEVGGWGDASVFNTAQVLSGLDAWDAAHDDPAARDAAAAAAEWLLRVQHDDGAWRDYTYGGLACAYYAHASCWLARFGSRLDEPRFTDGATRQLAWVLERQQPNGWFEKSGFPRDHEIHIAETHTFGYTLWGLLLGGEAAGMDDAVDAVRRAAEGVAGIVEREGWLPGRLDHEWRARAEYACLTGNAQLAQVWTRLAGIGLHVGRFRKTADRTVRLVMAAQSLDAREPGLRGGVPGSAPLGGAYLPNALPNWAVKFLLDALLDGAAGPAEPAEPGSEDAPADRESVGEG